MTTLDDLLSKYYAKTVISKTDGSDVKAQFLALPELHQQAKARLTELQLINRNGPRCFVTKVYQDFLTEALKESQNG